MEDITEQDLGIVAMEPKGTYNPETQYEKLNIVTSNGSSYVTLQDIKNIEPDDDGIYYQLLAEKGDPGDAYVLTEEDKQEIKNEIVNNANSQFNQNVSLQTRAFNDNYTEKLNDFNANENAKLSSFDDDYNSKLTSFNSNADTKISEYNANAQSKIDEYNENSTELVNKIEEQKVQLNKYKTIIMLCQKQKELVLILC